MRTFLAVLMGVLVVVGFAGVGSAQTTTSNATATGPQPADDPQGGIELFENVLAFIALVVFFFMAMGLASGSMAVAGWAGFLVFTYIALATDINNLVNVVYASLALVFVGIGFKAWRLEGGGDV